MGAIAMACTKRARLISLLAQMLILAALGHASAPRKSDRLLNVIFFESYITPSVKEGSAFDKFDWPTRDFPRVFSKLISLSGSQTIDVPSIFQFPAHPMFVDIYTFSLAGSRANRRASFSRRNDLTLIGYKLSVLFGQDGEYEVTLKGYHDGLKFHNVKVKAPNDRTEMIRIRLSANRTLYAALTFVPPLDEVGRELIHPKPISRPAPVYPSQIRPKNGEGECACCALSHPKGKLTREITFSSNVPIEFLPATASIQF
jgi:hypothetical protein